MKHPSITIFILCCSLVAALVSCEKDDSSFSDYDFSKYTLRSQQGDDEEDIATLPDTIDLAIAWNGAYADVSGDAGDSISVTTNGGRVTITSTTQRYLQLTVSGTSADGSLLVYSERKWGLVLKGLTLANADGPAINNQCSKALYVTVADGTENVLADGTAYADAPTNAAGAVIDQKGTLFSEGEIYFNGNGKLSVTGNFKNAIASDDYIVIGDTVTAAVAAALSAAAVPAAAVPAAAVPDASPSGSGSSSGPNIAITAYATNGIKVNDGIDILGGTLNILVDTIAIGGRGIRSEAHVTIGGGATTITTHGDCEEETLDDGTTDYSSCAGIKCDSIFTMTAGELAITSTGDGGKGINSGGNVEMKGGTLNVSTTGSNNLAKPKGVKSDKGIILSGGSFRSKVSKSWACDNGSDSSDIIGMLTIEGTPNMETLKLSKKEVVVEF